MSARKLQLIAVLFIVTLLVASCAPVPAAPTAAPTVAPTVAPTAAPTKAAEKATSGTITVYTALEDDQISKYLPSFNQKYPDIKVNIVRDSTGIVTAKLLAEKANPQADVVWGLAATSLLVADKEGMLEPYAPVGVEKVRANFKDSQTPPHWVGIDTWFSAFCVNTKELAAKSLPMPASWDDLLKPVYKGSIVMPNPNSSGTGYLSVSAILQMKGKDEGWKYLDKLNENMSVYTHSGSKPCKMAGAGEAVIGISFDYRAITQKAAGEPIEAVFPKEGSGWDTEANALIKKAKINPAARTFLDWAITEDAMKLYAKSYPVTAMDTGVAIPAGYPADPLKQLIANDLVKSAVEREGVLQEWMKRYDAKSEKK
jgi:iron(III) transport system substrate-binding protein